MRKNNFKKALIVLFILLLKFGVLKPQTITVSSFTKVRDKEELKRLKDRKKQLEELKKDQELNDSTNGDEVIFIVVANGHDFMKQSPEIYFPKFIEKNIKYPKEALKNDIEGTIIAQFSVNRRCEVVETHIIRGIHPVLDNEVIHVINSSSEVEERMLDDGLVIRILSTWSPRKHRGRVPRSTYIITINFALKNTKYKPLFRGDIPKTEFSKYIEENLIYPKEALEKETEGCVFVRFTVTKKGEVTNAHIFKGGNYFLNKEALRIINSSPKWDTSTSRGRPRNVTYVFPVVFKLLEDEY